MVGIRVVVAVALVAVAAVSTAGPTGRLPPLVLHDQEGRVLDLGALAGRIVVIVYGTRAGLEEHVEWGRRLESALVRDGIYRASDGPERRPVWILALAQMGGIPAAFRPVVRAFVRDGAPPDFSLWLDWEDRMSAHFGAHGERSTVVVSDREGTVRQVVVGPPSGAVLRDVVAMIRRLV